ncbi:MAG TPA: glycosyltransferase family 2 protein [Cytophagaceae bacterium]|nr:glycosyltransferase family 2 protein [Cytophagaceae bacterium]
MLSICIPIYNTSVVLLVTELYKQCEAESIDFEIICIDDASYTFCKEENKTIQHFPFLKYTELTKNVGRSAIRNLLAEAAQYEYLLFLDGDVSVPDSSFIKKYIAAIHAGSVVAEGGRIYKRITFQADTNLHFHYGCKREVIPTTQKKLNPYRSFVTGNFLIQKKIFDRIKFDSSLKEYGHEDTLFGLELKKNNVPIVYIDNPVVHVGLEKNNVFIQKQFTAVKNLSMLILQGYEVDNITLYRFYLILKKYYFLGFFIFGFGLIQPIVRKFLESGWTTWLVLFDALRLYELARYLKKSK